jgi:hypothetical protein
MWASFLEKMIEDAMDRKFLQYENCNSFVRDHAQLRAARMLEATTSGTQIPMAIRWKDLPVQRKRRMNNVCRSER